ncbi:MAG: polysaccharide biosynthesis protein [Clostridiales bacterium]|nr:polysaccharide biosynthesis protein [Clostridiales bacterium]
MSVNTKKQSMLNGAIILAVATVFVKLIGALYKIPLTDLIGAVGRGYFNSAYEIYTPIYAISMAGLPVAVSRLVSESVALGNYSNARAIYKVASKIFLITGVAGTALMFLIAYPYTHYIADPRNLPAVLAIAPSIFFCCAMSSYRGYYEGLRNMTPTAVSQIIEAITKLALGLGVSYGVLQYGLSRFNSGKTVFGSSAADLSEAYSLIYPYSAAGAILGVTAGTVFGLLYLMFRHRFKGDGFTRTELVNSPKADSNKFLAKRIIAFAIPMVASALILNITNLIDTVTIQRRLMTAIELDPELIKSMYNASFTASGTLEKDYVKYLYGTYGSVLDFRNLIPTITMSLGVSALPALSAAWTVNDKKNIRVTIESVIRVTMLIALPAGFGMAVLAKPILSFVYSNSADIIPIAVPLMTVYGMATFIMAASSPVTSMLQGLGRADIPVKTLVAGAIVKIVLNYILVGTPRFNINGAPIGSILCYIIIVGFNIYFLLRISKTRINFASVFLKPFICAALSAASAWSSYSLCERFLSSKLSGIRVSGIAARLLSPNTFSTLLAIGIAVVVYILSLLLLRALSKDDVTMLPKGEKIAKKLEKYGLLS